MFLNNRNSLALIGNNGCGKTTFVKCVLNQLKHRGILDSIDDVAVIPQDDIVFSNLTIKQYFKCMNTFDAQLIAVLKLQNVLNNKYGQLSGGQKRRLTIALVLSTRPDVVIMDEITAGSDYVLKRRVWSKLDQIARTRIVISHDIPEILTHADQYCLIRDGVGQMADGYEKLYTVVVYQRQKMDAIYFDGQSGRCYFYGQNGVED